LGLYLGYTKQKHPMMTIDPITVSRKQYADYSLETLLGKDFKTTDLRAIAPKVGISKIDRDGKTINANTARKEELAKAIYDACSDARIAKNIKSREIDDSEGINPTLYEEDVNRLAEKYYKGLHSYTLNCLRENIAFSPEFFTLVAPFREELLATVDIKLNVQM